MASLRDQLVAKGLASKKRAKRVSRELRDERKAQQGSRRKKKVEAREAKAREAEERAAQQAERREAREASRGEREAREHVLRVRQIVVGNRLGARGPVPFHHRRGEGTLVGTLQVPVATARDLRVGRAAIAGFADDHGRWSYHVVSERAAAKLAELAPEVLLHHVGDLDHLADPSQALSPRDWPAELGPRRVRDQAGFEAALAREQAREARLTAAADR